MITDQTGRSINVPEFPERIISLVPSQTELLHDLGLEDRVVGITKFCVHPKAWIKNKTRVGGTKILKYNVIKELSPDLIIANKEENTREDVERLSKFCPVWVSDVNNLNDALSMIKSVGQMTQTNSQAEFLMQEITSTFNKITPAKNTSVVYLIWRKPYMAAGKKTFINDMLARCGLTNVILDSRYPELKDADLIRLAPDVILFSSEPYPFKEHHMQTVQKLLPYTKLQLVDGEPFSWYGSRLKTSAAYFNKLIGLLEKQI